MSHWARLKIAFVVTLTAIGIIMISDMVFAFHLEDILFSPVIVVPLFVGSYLIAPLIGKRIRYK